MQRFLSSLALFAVLAAIPSANAQQFPSKPITLVVPFAAGGPIDVTARLIGDHMSRTLGQPIIIETVAGAGGTTGAARVAKAAADGHTILVHQLALAISNALYPTLNFQATTDFEPIALVNHSPIIVVARNSLPAKNVSELKAYGAANPISFAHAGVGSMAHLCGVVFTNTLGLNAKQVAYRGGGPALNDIAAGHVDLFCSSAQTAIPLINGGNMRGIGVTAAEPTTTNPPAESLVKHPAAGKAMDFTFWQIMVAPKGTPAPVITKLNDAVRQALADPGIAEKFKAGGVSAYAGEQLTPQFAKTFFLSEAARWTEVVRKNNITTK